MNTENLFVNYLSCKWAIAILFTLLDTPQRPAIILRTIHGMTKKIFYEKMSFMIGGGLIGRRVISAFPSHVEYYLTRKGMEVAPFLKELHGLKIEEESLAHVFKCKWLRAILLALFENNLRLAEMGRAIGKVSNKVLSSGLKKLEGLRLVEKILGAGVPIKIEYSLSHTGKQLAMYLTSLGIRGNHKKGSPVP